VASAREAVLEALRRARPPSAPVPPEGGPWSRPADRAAAFGAALEAAGGRCLRAGAAGLAEILPSLPAWRAASRIHSSVPGVEGRGAPPGSDPRVYDGLDLAVVPGRLGVAESGAVWVDGDALPQRALVWLAEHLVLVLSEADLVDHLHDAYARLRFEGPGFGVFVAGPSKTADIEQALVIGAQGPRTATVILV
jgi:L-lactate dehydrogenase complex protein LldG